MTLALVLLFGTTPAVADDGFVRLADGQRLYDEVSGEGCPAVLVAGGSGMDLRQWENVFASLAAKFRAVRYDSRRLGRSDAPSEPYSDADDLTALLDNLGIRRAAFIGVSSAGGSVLE